MSAAPPSAHLLVIAHGSRRGASNAEVLAVVERLRDAPRHRFASVEAAFLELAEPSVAAALERMAHAGARHVVLLPYFLAAGTHVSQDIPEILEAFRQRHPDIRLELKPHIGRADGMGRLILDAAEAAA